MLGFYSPQSTVMSAAVLLLFTFCIGLHHLNGQQLAPSSINGGNGGSSVRTSTRRLLQLGGGGGGGGKAAVEPDRIGTGCTEDDLVVHQGQTTPMPNGIPTYTVTIFNTCISGCSMKDIHLSCRWYSSARLVNPRIFRRLHYNDCLVNDGRPIPAGGSISFQYANEYSYPMDVSSFSCE